MVVFIHGMGEHFGRYRHMVAFLEAEACATIGFDLRGHGRSGGKRGHTPSYLHLMDDINLLMNRTREFFAGVPVFLYGHSLGGNLAANYVLRRKPELRGLILSAPYFKLAFAPPRWKVALSKLLAGLLPSLTLPTEIDVTALSREEAVVQAYKADPLVHDRISSAFFNGVHAAGLYPIEQAATLQVPTLVMHGTADRLTSAEGTTEFARKNPEMITLKLWEGFYHEIHQEKEQQQVFRFVVDWMAALL